MSSHRNENHQKRTLLIFSLLFLSPVMFQRQTKGRNLLSLLSTERIIIKQGSFHHIGFWRNRSRIVTFSFVGILALCLFGGRRRERVIRGKREDQFNPNVLFTIILQGDRGGWSEKGNGGFLWPVTHIFFLPLPGLSFLAPPAYALSFLSSLIPPCSFSSNKKGGGKNCGIERFETGGSG